jgi:hypothetical protein
MATPTPFTILSIDGSKLFSDPRPFANLPNLKAKMISIFAKCYLQVIFGFKIKYQRAY